MKKELSIRQLFASSLKFMGNNFVLLTLLAFLSFAGSYAMMWAGGSGNLSYLVLYGLFIYVFYYLFISLYFDKKPVFEAQRFVNAFVKMSAILVLSFFIMFTCKVGFKILFYLAKSLEIFPTLYLNLRHIYQITVNFIYSPILIYLSVILLLTFSFFIPGFAWMAEIEGRGGSIIGAYADVRGNYFKTVLVFVILYGFLPLLIGTALFWTSKTVMAILYAVQTVFQLVVYLHLYEFITKE